MAAGLTYSEAVVILCRFGRICDIFQNKKLCIFCDLMICSIRVATVTWTLKHSSSTDPLSLLTRFENIHIEIYAPMHVDTR